jgi:hypothetical protein
MREKLNDNPIAQIAVVAVLLVLAAVFLLGKMGGGSEAEGAAETEATTSSTVAVASTGVAPTGVEAGIQPVALPPPRSGPGSPPPLPGNVVAAIDADDTVVLLFVRDGGIDDRMSVRAVSRLGGTQGVATFVVPAHRLSHYIAITQGVKLSALPALVVVRPRSLDHGQPTASVQYGFQSPESIVQAVADARYHGGTLPYHP